MLQNEPNRRLRDDIKHVQGSAGSRGLRTRDSDATISAGRFREGVAQRRSAGKSRVASSPRPVKSFPGHGRAHERWRDSRHWTGQRSIRPITVLQHAIHPVSGLTSCKDLSGVHRFTSRTTVVREIILYASFSRAHTRHYVFQSDYMWYDFLSILMVGIYIGTRSVDEPSCPSRCTDTTI